MDNRLAETKVVSNTLHNVLVEGIVDKIHGLLPVFSPGNQFRDHGIIVHRYFATFTYTSVDTDVLVQVRFLVLGEETN